MPHAPTPKSPPYSTLADHHLEYPALFHLGFGLSSPFFSRFLQARSLTAGDHPDTNWLMLISDGS